MRGILKTTASERVKGIFQEIKGFRSTQKETKTSVTSIWKIKRKDGLDLRFKFSDISATIAIFTNQFDPHHIKRLLTFFKTTLTVVIRFKIKKKSCKYIFDFKLQKIYSDLIKY